MQFTHRERWLAIGLAVFITSWGLFTFGVTPAIERIETLGRIIPEKQTMLEELRKKSKQYLALRTGLDGLKKETASEEKVFEPLPFLESTIKESGMAKKTVSIKQDVLQLDSSYSEVIVEVKLEDITLKQIVEFLLKIKSANHSLWIKSLYVRKNAVNPNLLDTEIQISTLKPHKNSSLRQGGYTESGSSIQKTEKTGQVQQKS